MKPWNDVVGVIGGISIVYAMKAAIESLTDDNSTQTPDNNKSDNKKNKKKDDNDPDNPLSGKPEKEKVEKEEKQLKKMTDWDIEKMSDKFGGDAHSFKYDFLGKRAEVKLFDLKKDKYGNIYIVEKSSGKIVLNTKLNFKK